MKNTIISLRQKLIALPKKFAKDPRAKNLGGFAIVGLLAVIVWASAQTTSTNQGWTPIQNWNPPQDL